MNKNHLAVYIHWPFCKAKCPYCDFNSHVRDGVEQPRWRAALLRELEYMHERAADFTVSSIFFGGGTPSLMPPATAEAMIKRVRELWQVTDDIEITLEANPTSVEAGTFADFKAAGVNRVSLGVQSLRDEELKFLGRGHSASEAISAIKLAQKTFDRYSFDLIYARPKQTLEGWAEELAEAIALAGEHLSLYQLTIEENTAFHHAYKNGGFVLPSEEEAEELYRFTEEKMLENGFIPYEISNYAKAGAQSRHNLSYWQGDSYIGVGAGAHGRINNPICLGNSLANEASANAHVEAATLRFATPFASQFPQPNEFITNSTNSIHKRIATQTLKSPERWLENVEKTGNAVEIWEEVCQQSEAEERLMMGLRLRDGINYADFMARTGCDLREHINLKKRDFYIEKGLLENDNDNLKTTLQGRLLLNKLTAELLPS